MYPDGPNPAICTIAFDANIEFLPVAEVSLVIMQPSPSAGRMTV